MIEKILAILFFLSELVFKLSQPPQLAKPDEGPTLELNLEDEEEEKENEVNIDEDIAKNGSVACKYIELNPWHYTQEERHTYYQRSMQSVLCLVNLLIITIAHRETLMYMVRF